MAKRFYSLKAISEYLADNDKVQSITVTKFEQSDFNEMEGNQITFQVNVTTIDGYKNKRIAVWSNSSYFEWHDLEETAEAIETFLVNMYI